MSTTVQNGFYWRGQAYRRKGDIDRAIDDFSRAIAQAPQTERAAYNARAQLFIAKGDYARAIADFDKLLSLAPGNKTVQQQRQAAVAMQAELTKVHGAQPAPAASPNVAVSPRRRPRHHLRQPRPVRHPRRRQVPRSSRPYNW